MAQSKCWDSIYAALAADVDDCILWPHAVRKSSGYGAFSYRKHGRKHSSDAHRLTCEMAHGTPLGDMQAAHHCGNKLCINPRHLYWADRLTNMADAKNHGTLRGGGRYRQRFFAEQLREICMSGDSIPTLAAKFNSDVPYVARLRRQHASEFA